MKLSIEFPHSRAAQTDLKAVKTPVPIFLTHDGVFGHVCVDSAESLPRLAGARMEIRLVGMDSRLFRKIRLTRRDQGYIKTSMVWAESSIASPDGKSLAISHKVSNFTAACVQHLMAASLSAKKVTEIGKVLDLLQRPPLRLSNDDVAPRSQEILHFHFPLNPVTLISTGLATDGQGRRACSTDLLPSSLDEKSSMAAELKSSTPKTTVVVFYQVQAKLYLGDAFLGSASRQVHIFDCSEVAPPLCLGDFGSEYKSRQEAVLRKNVLQKFGMLSMEATQPDPFVFSYAGDTATTKVLLQASVRKTVAPLEADDPDTFEVAVTWKLQSSTFVSMERMDRQPTIRQAACSSSMVRLVKTGQGQRLKMMWSDWIKSDPPDSVKRETSTQWTAVHPLWLSIKGSSTLAPTFSLPYVSHRYSILLDFAISGPGRSRTTLKIPIQLLYRSEAAYSACLLEHEPSCSPTTLILSPFLGASDGHNVDLPPYIA